jgi:hypothetical protein
MKKVSGKASAVRASTGRSMGSSGIPGAENTKTSTGSAAVRKSGGSQSTRKQNATNYINKNNLVDSHQRKSVNVGNGVLDGDHQPLSQNSTFTNDGHSGMNVPT